MQTKETGRKPQIREQLGMALTLLAFLGVFAIPFIPTEQKKEAVATVLGLWGIGVVALAPYLNPPSNHNKTVAPLK